MTESLQRVDPDCEVKMIHGFDHKNRIGRLIFENGYSLSQNWLHGLFPLTYDLGQYRPIQTLFKRVIRRPTVRYFVEVLKKEKPTDIVCFHFALSMFIKEAVKMVDPSIKLNVMITDPFTVPNCWYYDKTLKYLVYSQQAKDHGIELGVPAENIKIIPFVLNKKYTTPFTKEDILALRKKHGFDPDKKVLLMVGGGEGIPGAIEIINKCILKKAKFSVAVVCGKDAAKKKYFEGVKALHPKFDFHVYGFVNYLDELVKLSDCVVMKAGPATLLEVLSCKKPVIICRYIHNQELGNMRFAVDNKVGSFIQKPGKIFDKVEELLNDEKFDEHMKEKFDALTIDTETDKISKYLLEG
ncbi:MAG: glycosyltransferase [Treponema sp.]|nr:glycosyltransferase [Treponema sp.]